MQIIIQVKIPETMSYKTCFICLKSSFVSLFLLLLQPVFAQYNWTELDSELQANQKLLGNDLVVMHLEKRRYPGL